MNHDEPYFEEKVPKFSVLQVCPKCKKLSLSYKDQSIICSNCGYAEKFPNLR